MPTSLTKELLNELLDSSKRDKYIKEICEYVDKQIKHWLLHKKIRFFIY